MRPPSPPLWKADYSVGIKKIDNQHQELFRRFGLLMDAMSDNDSQQQLPELIKFLNDYVITHFRDEEAMMAKLGAPELEHHKAIHEDFIDDLKMFNNDFQEEGASLTVANNLLFRLSDWLINHILHEDQKVFHGLKEPVD